MSSSEDSETAEWEREQMLRGSQSRGRQQQQCSNRQQAGTTNTPRAGKPNSSVIDATYAKHHVKCDIDRVEGEIESVKRNIGSTRIEIARAEKRIDAIKKQIEQLEQVHPFFEEIGRLKDPAEVILCLRKNKDVILNLPRDQKETIDLLEKNMRSLQCPDMEVDD